MQGGAKERYLEMEVFVGVWCLGFFKSSQVWDDAVFIHRGHRGHPPRRRRRSFPGDTGGGGREAYEGDKGGHGEGDPARAE